MSNSPAAPNRSDAADYLGSTLYKQNNQNLPPDNSQTDFDNTLTRYGYNNIAALMQTAPRIIFSVTLAASTASMTLNWWYGMWQNASPQPPPIPSRSSTGSYVFTLPTVVSNEVDASIGLVNNITINLIGASFTPNSSSTFCHCQGSASGNLINLYTFNNSGSLADFTIPVVIVGY